MANSRERIRLAIIVSHPIQYYAPLYRSLAAREDLRVKVFYTWHAAEGLQHDRGFQREFKWDIPLTEGYDYELVPNASGSPGTHHFWGLRNPALNGQVEKWRPDAVHITGYSFASHLSAMRHFHKRGIPILLRGDSHLLDHESGVRWQAKRFLVSRIYELTSACLYVGKNNCDYYRALGVAESKLFYCPHSIEVERFAGPHEQFEQEARQWRRGLSVPADVKVVLFAGKFEKKKRPLELMRVIADLADPHLMLIMVGNGELEDEVRGLAEANPQKFRVLPFQNQTKMPIVYRLGDVFTLPSAYGETWGLSVNEAIASGRPVLVSDKVGCAPDVVAGRGNGAIFSSLNEADFGYKLRGVFEQQFVSADLIRHARHFDISVTEGKLCNALCHLL